jgi:YfiR/HmsC-like
MAVLGTSPNRSLGLRWLFVLLLLGAPFASTAERARDAQATERLREYAVKVTMLFKLALFVEWPASEDGASDDAFVIGVLGTDPFGPLLDDVIADERIEGRPVKVLRADDLEPLLSSRILFISRSEEPRLAEVLPRCRERGILTVGESPRFCQLGGMVNLVLEAGRIQIDLNRKAALEAGLRVNAKLIQLAREVDTESTLGHRRSGTDNGGDRVSP